MKEVLLDKINEIFKTLSNELHNEIHSIDYSLNRAELNILRAIAKDKQKLLVK